MFGRGQRRLRRGVRQGGGRLQPPAPDHGVHLKAGQQPGGPGGVRRGPAPGPRRGLDGRVAPDGAEGAAELGLGPVGGELDRKSVV